MNNKHSIARCRHMVVCSLLLAALLSLSGGCVFLTPSARQLASSPTLDLPVADRSETDADGSAVADADAKPQMTAAQKLQQDIATLQQRQHSFNAGLDKWRHSVQTAAPDSAAAGGQQAHGTTIKQQTQPIKFDFDQAELQEVIRLFMTDILHADYIIQGDIGGKVTMSVDADLARAQLWSLFEGVLRINHVALFQQDGIWHLLPLTEAPSSLSAGSMLIGADKTTSRGQTIQPFTLKYIATAEMVKIITPYLSKGAMVYAHEASGTLLLCDYPHTLAKVAKLINQFDVSPFAGMHARLYWLKYVKAETILKELDTLAQQFSLSAGKNSSPNSALSFIALPRLNLILVLTREQQSLQFADMWIAELDREIPELLQTEAEDGVFIYSVKNGLAKDIVTVLEGLFSGKKATRPSAEKVEKLPAGARLTRLSSGLENKKHPARKPGATAVSGTLSGDVSFVVDEVSNAILIRANSDDYRKIVPIVEKLDVYPKQALIEVTIAEVLLDESTKLGVEWGYLSRNVGGSPTTSSNLNVESGLGVISGSGKSLIGSGLSYLLVNTDRFTTAIKAFSDQNKVNVLSSPHIMASDNQEASIDIGDEVPIVTSEYRTTGAASTDTSVDKTIQYRDVGVILRVTPHINANGMVRMEISQEVSEISNKTVEGVASPVFSKRAAQTILSVNDSQTIVIAGLMQQHSTKAYSGVPWIARLPLLKYLFGYTGNSFRSTELMIFITPHVILNKDDSTFLNQSFLTRLGKIKAGIMQ